MNPAMTWDDGTEQEMVDVTFRGKARRFLESSLFDVVMAFVLVFTVYLVVRSTDFGADEAEEPTWLQVCSLALLALFTGELIFKLWVYRMAFFKSRLNIFEFAVVALDLLSLALSAFAADLPTFTVFRVVRIMRVFRAARILRTSRELVIMTYGFICTIKAVFWCLCLLLVYILILAVLAVELIHPLNVNLAEQGMSGDADAFSSVFRASITFFQQVVAGDSWGLVTIPIIKEYPWTGPFFIFVLASIEMALMNLIIAAIVDRAAEARQAEEQNRRSAKSDEYHYLKQKLKHSFKKIDTDGSGQIGIEEMLQGYDADDDFRTVLEAENLGKEDLKTVYNLMDSDKSGSVGFLEFVDQLWRMKNMDSHMMLVFIRHHITEVLHKSQENFYELSESLNSVMTQDVKIVSSIRDELQERFRQHSSEFEQAAASLVKIDRGEPKASTPEVCSSRTLELKSRSMGLPLDPHGPAPDIQSLEHCLQLLRLTIDREVRQLHSGSTMAEAGADSSTAFSIAESRAAPCATHSFRRTVSHERWVPGSCCSVTRGQSVSLHASPLPSLPEPPRPAWIANRQVAP